MSSSPPLGDAFLSLGDYSRAKAFFAWKCALDAGDVVTLHHVEELARHDMELQERIEAHHKTHIQDAP